MTVHMGVGQRQLFRLLRLGPVVVVERGPSARLPAACATRPAAGTGRVERRIPGARRADPQLSGAEIS